MFDMTGGPFQDRVVHMTVSGIVIHGDGFGRTLGFPTANIDRDEYIEKECDLAHGIYAGVVTRESGAQFVSGIVIGPVDKQGLPKLEAHLLDFDGDLYGERLTFSIKDFLRPFEEYETMEMLKAAIKKDITTIKNLDIQV